MTIRPGRQEIVLQLWDGVRHQKASSLEDLIRIAEQTVKSPASEDELDSELPQPEEAEGATECPGCGGRINPDYGKCLRCE